MSSELSLFKRIIKESNYDNTYKMAWARSLVELSCELELNTDSVVITLEQIAEKYIKYYWNQTIFFNLMQGSNPNKPPVIVTLVKELIEEYYKVVGNNMPELYERIIDKVLKVKMFKSYNKVLKKIATTLKYDVSWRFTFLDNKYNEEIYKYTKGNNELSISKNLMLQLRDNEQDLYDLINYRWGLILETFNSSPRINKKIKIMDEREIKRNSLDKFKKYLDLENGKHECFICGNKIEKEELSIDHVIPWSYMYSDDIWNLVYVCKSCNSRKTNRIPDKANIDKLKERNIRLLNRMNEENIKNKLVEELKLANEKDYVTKFWIGSKN